MDDKTFTVNVYTPEELFLNAKATYLGVPGTDGGFGLLYGHTPCVIALAAGEIVLKNGGEVRRFKNSAGFLEMQNNVANIFVNVCEETE